ncbi:hypothetical protein HPULCUR_003155 [Helicostylum pulchrum]|uniref:Uncharacterized protein n=1 Tax=Helicostylum pulchrum TaxID=562976 RepID=A0ABP9XSM5_9FUNG
MVLKETGSDHKPKTFIKLPPDDIAYLFVPVLSSADNEINAHTSMFNPKKTDHYYELGSDSIALINEMVARFQRKNVPHPVTNYPYYPPASSSKPAFSDSISSQSNTPKSGSYPYYPPPGPVKSSGTSTGTNNSESHENTAHQ